MRIRITWGTGEAVGVLEDTPTARGLVNALPHRSRANTWGKEVYFDLPVEACLEKNATDVVPPGTICYWVQGSSLALPYGPTPVSHGQECRLVTAVNILGRLEGDPSILAFIKPGDFVTVSLADE
ncbi:MAG: hypothetical protein HZB26_03360 [Candidatus Hydrogenedentes bacterium]|nr:hypothetical protein [Candidatus Hydrogenedentota bacterium]